MFSLTLLLVYLFSEKTLQQDMLDFLQGARGQDFHDITLMVDGEAIGAHKVRDYLLIRSNRLPENLASTLLKRNKSVDSPSFENVMEELCLLVKTRCDNGGPTKAHINKKSWNRFMFCQLTG